MSIKQMEHSEHYHITNEYDYKNIELEDEIDDLCCELKESVVDEANKIIEMLETITAELHGVNPALIREAVNQYLTPQDKKEMVDLYVKCFDELPNNSDIKIYVLQMFHNLCIPITRSPVIIKENNDDGNTYIE